MGRTSKWLRLVKKARAFVLRKSKVHSTNGILIPDDIEVPSMEIDKLDEEWTDTYVESAKVSTVSPPLEEPISPAVTPTLPPSSPIHPTLYGEFASLKIQSAYRGFKARKRVKEMRAIARLQTVLHGRATKKQTLQAMRCMQSFARMQSQVRNQRTRISEFQILRREQLEKESKKPEEELNNWDDSVWSKEQIRAKIQSKHEAAVKRERTLAYAFSHQLWRSYPKDLSPMAQENGDKPVWSWSWLEQWMSSRTWESLLEPVNSTPGFKSAMRTNISPVRKHSPTELRTSASPNNRKVSPSPTRNIHVVRSGKVHSEVKPGVKQDENLRTKSPYRSPIQQM